VSARSRWAISLVAVAAGFGLVRPCAAHGQSADSTALKGSQEVASLYAIPENPAVTFLNASAARITQPVTPKAFLAALASGIDAQGHAHQGWGLEVSPFALIPAFHLTLAEYRSSLPKYWLSNLQFSFAAVATSGDSSSTDLGYGVRATFYDAGDPLRDSATTNSLGELMLACAPSAPPTGPAPEPSEAERATQLACIDRKSDSLAQMFAHAHWNAARVMVAWAGGQRLKGSAQNQTGAIGNRVWAVGSYGFGPMQLIGYAAFTSRPAIDTLSSYQAWSYGARVNVGSTTFNGFAELLGQSATKAPAGVPKSTSAWSAGIEFRVASGFWIETGFGERFQESPTPEHTVVLANIRWGTLSKPALDPR
jgi:hypothetical protein